jgi:transketolase
MNQNSKHSFDQLKPLKFPNKLAPTPQSPPRYHKMVKDREGLEQLLGDPTITRALVALMDQFAVNGGAASHWGGPSAFAEIMSAIHGIMFKNPSQNWFDLFNFVNDAGHTENGIYALRANYGFDNFKIEELFKFRSIESKLTGHGEAHLNPQGVFISNGPLGSGLPQAQGLSIADKILGNSRITICTISDGGCMEGEAKESFAAIPGLALKGMLNPFVLIISDNNTKLSGRIDKDSFSMAPTFNSLKELGWNVFEEEDGHNLQKVYTTLENSIIMAKENPSKPVAIRFKTIKGYGIKSTQDSSSGGHGFPLGPYSDKLLSFLKELFSPRDLPNEFENWANKALTPLPKTSSAQVKMEKVQVGLSKAAIRAAKEGLPIFSISSDLQGSTGISSFHKEFPNRYLDLGVAESNMVSTGVGLSKLGLIPIVDTFAQFGITKGNLPLIMGSLSQGPVIALFSHTGFQDAADGASHQTTTFLSATSSIPHTTVIQLSCSKEAEELLYQAIINFKTIRERGETPDHYLFFLGRENHPPFYKDGLTYEWGKAQVIVEGTDGVIVASGPMVQKALLAQKNLSEKGIFPTVINNPFINQPDTGTIWPLIKKNNGILITIEDHQLIGGMGAQLSHRLKLENREFKIKCLANHGEFGQSAYEADHLYALHSMDENAILKCFKELGIQ